MWEMIIYIELFFQFTKSVVCVRVCVRMCVHTLTHQCKTYTHTTGCKTGRVQSKSSAPTCVPKPNDSNS